jgi:hypothetical protein
MKKRRIIQPILWTERPTGAVMGVGSVWPCAGTQFGGLEYGRFWIRVIKSESEPGLILGTGFGLRLGVSFFPKNWNQNRN